MPTGYTAPIADGIKFEDFVLQCARAFGATIHQRDDAMDAKLRLPEVSDYHKKHLASAKGKMTRMRNKTLGDLLDAAESQSERSFKSQEKAHQESCKRNDELREAYNSMRTKVEAWEPPTEDHCGLKKFMLEQIDESIRFDCSHYPAPTRLEPMEFFIEKMKRTQRDVDYHSKEWKAEQERIEERRNWITSLGASLGVDISD